MNKTLYKLVLLSFIICAIPSTSFTQDNTPDELAFEVNRIYPSFSMTKEQLSEAKTIFDLNEYNKASWVREYKTVEILTSINGSIKKATGKNGTLTQQQKENLNNADPGTNIEVTVLYIPENNLSHNDVQELNFIFSVIPSNEAVFAEGQQQLNQYLLDNAINKIPEGTFVDYDLSIIRFSIDEQGDILDAYIFENAFVSSNNEDIDKMLLEVICKMPRWTPAKYDNGLIVKQDFVLTVGNHQNCTINTLNIWDR